MLLATQLRHIRSLDGEIASLSQEIAARQQPHEAALTQLQTIPGADPPAWVLGFQDETWWSRLARPALQAWAEPDQPLRLVEQTVAKTDPDPKALACYGLLVRWAEPAGRWHEEAWLRFVDGRPVSALTTWYLTWCCAELPALGKEALLLIRDNAAWHVSREVRTWIRRHNRKVKLAGAGVRIVPCYLPIKSPWLNPSLFPRMPPENALARS